MKAFFIGTKSNEVDNHIAAWDSAFGPAATYRYDLHGLNNDWNILETVEKARPEIIFYIGAHQAPGNPKPASFIALRKIAPLINLVSDAADTPWHPVLRGYRTKGCFDLQVSIDGARNAPAIDAATLTPIDLRHFDGPETKRDIRCGFSGTVGRWNARSETVNALEWFGGLTVRRRETSTPETNGYASHVAFLKRCRMVINLSFTGSQLSHHVKGRVLEAAFAGCGLLEHRDSPIAEWFPENSYFSFGSAPEAADLIRSVTDEEIAARAARLSAHARANYTARQVYGSIIGRLPCFRRGAIQQPPRVLPSQPVAAS